MEEPEYISSWEISPEQQGNLHYDDWHHGFSHADDTRFPAHPGNIAYMMGWLQALGMNAGYANVSPGINNASYMAGYNQAIYERNLRPDC